MSSPGTSASVKRNTSVVFGPRDPVTFSDRIASIVDERPVAVDSNAVISERSLGCDQTFCNVFGDGRWIAFGGIVKAPSTGKLEDVTRSCFEAETQLRVVDVAGGRCEVAEASFLAAEIALGGELQSVR